MQFKDKIAYKPLTIPEFNDILKKYGIFSADFVVDLFTKMNCIILQPDKRANSVEVADVGEKV